MDEFIGSWESELGSVLTIEKIEHNQLIGTFTTHTGSTQGTYMMVGSIGFDESLVESDVGGSVGWVVSWNSGTSPENSVTTWTGQFKKNTDKQYIIVATWLYCRGMKPEDDWNSTLIGSNTFNKIK
ncbi:avidin/streptavidin family protein [Motiliproteus sp. MSK22-1]|uniref:avidin/streptavidin family protein n=1 Tax=Motiliproteus sp. MSK22-1 TaxID=1897630 RepID=UPI0013013479|nr:avidin/streptavidin family protein [Motiliproteus sp. MSK22-1]